MKKITKNIRTFKSMKHILISFLITYSICITYTTNPCSFESTGDEDRKKLLCLAIMTCKSPLWPESCVARYPRCPFSRERVAHDNIIDRLLELRGPYYSPNHGVKQKCLACYTDSCSHPFFTTGSTISIAMWTVFAAIGFCDTRIYPCEKCLPASSTAIPPVCGLVTDYYCRDCLTNPAHWQDELEEEPEAAIADLPSRQTEGAPIEMPDDLS